MGEAAYLYAGDSHDLVFEQVTLAGAGGVTSRKVALSPEGPLAIRSTDAVGTAVTRYPLQDPHGDVIALFRKPDRLTGTRTYSPWGEPRAETGDAAVSPFGFQGDWTDPGTGQVDMGARMYEPSLGRFTTMDPLFGQTTNPLSLNRFTYTEGNPLTYTDPTGLYRAEGGSCPSCASTRASGSSDHPPDAISAGVNPYEPNTPDPILSKKLRTQVQNRVAIALDISRAEASDLVTGLEDEIAACTPPGDNVAECQSVIDAVGPALDVLQVALQVAVTVSDKARDVFGLILRVVGRFSAILTAWEMASSFGEITDTAPVPISILDYACEAVVGSESRNCYSAPAEYEYDCLPAPKGHTTYC